MENDIPIDLGETCCKLYRSSDLCPAVCPVSESLFKLVVVSALDCLEAIEEFPLHSGQSRRGETEWSTEVNEDGGLMVLVQHLHQYLELIRRALNTVCKPPVDLLFTRCR